MKSETIHLPDCENELANFVKDASYSRTPLRVIGGDTRPIGNPVIAKQTIGTTKITGITDYDPGALTIVVKAGTRIKKLKSELAKENQHLAFEPADYRALMGTSGSSTIGGVVAAGVSGPRRIQAGKARDSLIGVRFVNGEGDIIKSGGRVMKNVTGYDLTKLMVGSYGSLGILSEVSFKLLPVPETSTTLVIEGLNDSPAIEILTLAMRSSFDISGASHISKFANDHAITMIRIEGFEKSVSYRTEKLMSLISVTLPKKFEIKIQTNSKTNASNWKKIRDVEMFSHVQNQNEKRTIWRLSIKPTDGPNIVETIRHSTDCETIYDCAGGLIWLRLEEDTNTANTIRDTVSQYGGHATLIRSGNTTHSTIPVFHSEHKRVSELGEMLRLKFDPHSIFNRGIMNFSKPDLLGVQ